MHVSRDIGRGKNSSPKMLNAIDRQRLPISTVKLAARLSPASAGLVGFPYRQGMSSHGYIRRYGVEQRSDLDC